MLNPSQVIPKKLFFGVYSLKKAIINIIIVSFITFLLIFSRESMIAVKESLSLWCNNVIPSLFPFLIATSLLSYTNIPKTVSKIFARIMRPLFNVPGIGAYAFLLGIISGYPIGAKVVVDLYSKKACTKSEAEDLLAFTNNSGPLFIIGTIGISFFRSIHIGILLFITHILSAISTGFVLGILQRKNKKSNINTTGFSLDSYESESNPFNIGLVLRDSIVNSVNTLLLIGGFIVFFAVIINMLKNSHLLDLLSYMISFISKSYIDISYIKGFLAGIIEITNGIFSISIIPTKFITINILLCAFLLGFGGLSVFFQVSSISFSASLSMKSYILGKLLQGIFAVIYTFIFINCFPIFNFNL